MFDSSMDLGFAWNEITKAIAREAYDSVGADYLSERDFGVHREGKPVV